MVTVYGSTWLHTNLERATGTCTGTPCRCTLAEKDYWCRQARVWHKLLTCAVGALPCPWLLEPGAGPGVVPRGSALGPLPRPRGCPWEAYRQGGDAGSMNLECIAEQVGTSEQVGLAP